MYRRTGASWGQEAYLKATNPDFGDNFGNRVAVSADGNVLAVSAHLEDSAALGVDGNQSDNSASNSGAVYVFRRTGSNWGKRRI